MQKLSSSLIFLQCILPLFIKAQSTDYYFKRIGLKDGLSQSMINCIAQDTLGYMWFGTQDGLNRYDGYEFKTFKHSDLDKNTLLDNNISVIYKDHAGDLWVGSRFAGLNKYSYKNQNWERYKNKKSNDFNVLSIADDTLSNLLWVGTNKGVLSFNKNDKRWGGSITTYHTNTIVEVDSLFLLLGTPEGLKLIRKFKKRPTTLYQHTNSTKFTDTINIQSIAKGIKEIYWIGTKKNGLYTYKHTNKEVQHINTIDFGNKEIRSLFYDNTKHELWIGTNRGLAAYDIANSKIKWIKNDPELNYSLSNDLVLSIFKSESGLLWIGTQKDISLMRKFGIPFYIPNEKAKKFFRTFVWSFYEDENELLWVGTDKGLIKYNPNQNKINSNSTIKNFMPNKTIRAVCRKKNSNELWVGTTDGLFLFNKDTSTYRKISLKNAKDDFIRTVYEDSSGLLWIGTEDGGIITYKAGSINYYKSDSTNKSLGDNRVLSFYEDKKGEMWIGTYGGGLNKFNKKNSSFTHYKYLIKGTDTLKTILACMSICPDSNTFWVGTIGEGLLKFDKSKECFTEQYTMDDDLPNNTVYGILKNPNYLWLSTNNGLSRFNPKKKQFWNFDHNSDGLQNNEFNAGAYLKSKAGLMYFGGINGFSNIHQDSIKEHEHQPLPIITSIKTQIKDKLKELWNNQTYHNNNVITLAYTNNSFAIEFTSIHFPSPHKIKYKWRLIHKNNQDTPEWQKASYLDRKVSFYGLNSGEYEFQVKSTNCDGVWEGTEQPRTLYIKIKKPWWEDFWLWIVISSFIVALIYLYASWGNIKHIKLESKLKFELKEEQHKSTKLELADKLIAWFAHETKTPLEIIYTGITTIQKLLGKIYVNANTKEFYRMQRINENSAIILENAQHTNRIIKQLRIISLKQLESDLREINLQEFILELFESLKYSKKDKDIKLDLVGDYNETTKTYPIALRQIFFNLFINSFMHGFPDRKKGEITINIKKRSAKFEIEYSDNGNGIKKDIQKKIFAEFFTSIKGGGGTGLGMYIITTILERDFEGSIRLKESIPQKQTTFAFTIKRFDI